MSVKSGMYGKVFKQLKIGLSLLLFTIITGIAGYMIIEGWDFIDSFYMTIITITTTGFKEVHTLNDAGKLFTLLIIFMGMGSIAYITGRSFQIIFESQIFRRRRMSKKVEEMNDHYIVCGYGRMGKYICEELNTANAQFLVIENNPAKIERLIELGYVFVNGDSTSDTVLLQAGVKRAKGLVAVLSNDAENVFATLSAKVLNPKIFVVSRAVEEETESKLTKAGADRVVKPYEAGGTWMASLLLRPAVIDFIDVVARENNVDLNIEEFLVNEKSPLVNKTLAESPIRKDLNVIIVSIQKPDGKFIYNPGSSTKIGTGDKLVALGEEINLKNLKNMCTG